MASEPIVIEPDRPATGDKSKNPIRRQPRGVYRDDGTIMMLRAPIVVGGPSRTRKPKPPTLPIAAGGSGLGVPSTPPPASLTQAIISGVAPSAAAIARAVNDEEPGFAHLKVEMMRQSLALFAVEVLRAPNTGGPFLIGRHHEAWSDLVTQHDRLGIMAPRDPSKCSTGGALILAGDGSRVRTDEWRGGRVLAFDPATQKFRKVYSPAARRNGLRDVLRVTTRTGRKIMVTENHPFLTFAGWRQADTLHAGERIAVPYRTSLGLRKMVRGAWLLGLLVGDGGLKGGACRVTVADKKTVSALRAEVAGMGLGWDVHSVSGSYAYSLSKQYAKRGGPCEWLRSHGLLRKGSHTKRVPQAIFKSSDATIAGYLAGYLDSDGCVSMHGGGSVSYGSVSEDLLRDTQHLLTRLGVVSVLGRRRGRYKGAVHWSWGLVIRGKDILRFAQAVKPRGKKNAELRRLVATQLKRGVCSGRAVDCFPKDVWKLVQHGQDWFRHRGFRRPNRQYEPTREKLLSLAAAEKNEALRRVAEADVLWDEIVSIEPAGKQETWSICVPGLENYVAEDIVNHNSAVWSYAYILWRAYFWPRNELYLFSKTQEQANKLIGYIKDELEGNPKLAHLLPPPGDRENWTKGAMKLANGFLITAKGYGVGVRGAHPRFIVADDVLSDDDAYSEITRIKTVSYFQSAITNMVIPGGQIVCVGTPQHAMDLFAWLRKNPVYRFVSFPAIEKGPDGQPRALWDTRYTLADLERRRAEIGEIAFTREFLLVPIADSLSLFPTHLFQGPDVQIDEFAMRPTLWMIKTMGLRVFFGIDFAMSAATGADFTCIFVVGVDPSGNRWVIDIIRAKGLGFQQQIALIKDAAQRYNPTLIFAEANQMQRIFSDELIRTTDLPVRPFVTGRQKNQIEVGVPSMRILFENRKMRIPRGDEYSRQVTDVWMSEMQAFGWLDGKLQGVGEHDDTVMALYMCEMAIRAGGFSFTFGDDDDTKVSTLERDILLEEREAEDADLRNEATVRRLAQIAMQAMPEPRSSHAYKEWVHARKMLGIRSGEPGMDYDANRKLPQAIVDLIEGTAKRLKPSAQSSLQDGSSRPMLPRSEDPSLFDLDGGLLGAPSPGDFYEDN